MNLDNVRYMYIGNRRKSKTHVITVAYTRDDHKIYFGVTYCRNDDLYDKKYGRELAKERLMINGNDGLDIIEGESVCTTIWNYLVNNKRGTRLTYNKPSWVNEVMLMEKALDQIHGMRTRMLHEQNNGVIGRSFIGKVLEFFGFC